VVNQGQTTQWPTDTKGVIRSGKSRTDNTMANRYQRGNKKWYLLAIVLSVLHYHFLLPLWYCLSLIYHFLFPFGIFWPLYCLSLIYHFLFPLWYLLAIVLSVLHLPLLITPLVSFGHCVVCPWSGKWRTENTMPKRSQRGIRSGKWRTDNTMANRYQRGNKKW
jgi:hypothetical protein